MRRKRRARNDKPEQRQASNERLDEVVHAMKHTFTGAGTEQGRIGK